MNEKKHVKFQGRLVIVGFGSVGQGTLPLLLRHIDMPLERIRIVTGDTRGVEEAKQFGVKFTVKPLTRENYRAVLEPLVSKGDFLLNLSVEVSSVALIEFCHKRGVMYLDTCIEPWLGGYTDTSVSASRRSNYGLREEVMKLRTKYPHGGPTVIPTHGANPGLISHWVKQALINLSRDIRKRAAKPESKADWARLAMELGVKVIHCSERDTQVANPGKRRLEFVNTWSVDGFVGEGSQPCELGWGSHEKHFPRDAKQHKFGGKAAIYLTRPGASVRVRTWTPVEGNFHGFLITHGEAISISDYYTVRAGKKVVYRPTCHYAYHPCDSTILSLARVRGQELGAAREQAHIDGRDIRRHRRTGRAAHGACQGRILVRLAAVDTRSAQARALQQRHQPAGGRRRDGGRDLGDGKSAARRVRSGRSGFPARARNRQSLPRQRRRHLYRLEPAQRSRAVVSRGRG